MFKSIKHRLIPGAKRESNSQSKDEREFLSILEKDEVGRLKILDTQNKIDLNKPIEWPQYRIHGMAVKPFFISATRTAAMVTFFLQRGISIHERTQMGETALHFTAMYRGSELDIVRVLVDAGININAQDTDRGFTALHCACENRNHGIVRMLLDNHVNKEITDCNGATALDIAKSVRCDQTIALLECTAKQEKHEEEIRSTIQSTDMRMKAIEIQMQQQSVTQQQLQNSILYVHEELRRSTGSLNTTFTSQTRHGSLPDLGVLPPSTPLTPINRQNPWEPFQTNGNGSNFGSGPNIPVQMQSPFPANTNFSGSGQNVQFQMNPMMAAQIQPNHVPMQMTGFHNQNFHPQATVPYPYHQPIGMPLVPQPAIQRFNPSLSSSLHSIPPQRNMSSISITSLNTTSAELQRTETDTSGVFDDTSNLTHNQSAASLGAVSLSEDHPDHRLSRRRYSTLRLNIQELMDNIDPNQLKMKLFAKDVLKQNRYDELACKPREEQNRIIIMDIIMRGNNSDFDVFMECVRSQSTHLASMLEAE